MRWMDASLCGASTRAEEIIDAALREVREEIHLLVNEASPQERLQQDQERLQPTGMNSAQGLQRTS